MPFLANDRLDPALSHGDLLLSISADSPDVCVFALRQLMRRTRGALVLHWMLDGFNRHDTAGPGSSAPRYAQPAWGSRTAPPTSTSRRNAAMDRHVWVQRDDREPEWAAGGSYQVVRIIRMFVEFWDRTALSRSRRRSSAGRSTPGAPRRRASQETDIPDYAADPDGRRTPLDAHIRLANPRTPETDGEPDPPAWVQLLAWASTAPDGSTRVSPSCRSSAASSAGSSRCRQRLNGEPLEEYILPVGGGFFYALPGARNPGEYLGERLFAS